MDRKKNVRGGLPAAPGQDLVCGLRPHPKPVSQYPQHFCRQVEHLHRLGPRPVGELLWQIVPHDLLLRVLSDYSRLSPDVVAALSGDRFPSPPIREVSP